MKEKKIAVVLLSGGLDSVTVLAYARSLGYECHTLSFDYGQRHHVELQEAKQLSISYGAVTHRVMQMNMAAIGGSALTDLTIDVPVDGVTDTIPVTYVPARNTIFLSYALGLAEVIKAQAIFIGVNAVDYSGYPDCRPEYIAAFEALANLATKSSVEGQLMKIETPLINLTKAQIIKMGTDLGVDYSKTISCYQADDQGRACGVCDSCRLRRQGFFDAGLDDPTRYR
ncbi:7-cyano-7-deazaguanine synthase QueC [Thiomicrospira microaerophila]|uniref:7-cyano-7-deazaguanine synthase QueC n=1 Tax=Thiomicrospira microaerophila TaxID=406020 RepID=UPI00200FB5A6|nr:7-cyano-7-deazaguanine synthase QueC [Thiomicrospira microaerophila]UQB41458.1 7-cyano-7-deazaguanine synthase QueC [Thiomicrospira microaerophila]